MPKYQIFDILDLKTGKYTRRDPWLSPKDAFETMLDCSIKRGVFEKRRGYAPLGQMVYIVTSTGVGTLQTDPITGIFNHLSGNTQNLLIGDSERLNKIVIQNTTGLTVEAITIANAGSRINIEITAHGLSDDAVIQLSGTTNYNGVYQIERIDADNFEVPKAYVSDEAAGTVDELKFTDITRNGIRYIGKTGQNYSPSPGDIVEGGTSGATGIVKALIVDSGSIANDDARGTIIFENEGVTGTFQDNEELQESGTPANIAGQSQGANADIVFSGDNTNYYWAENWNDKTYITNNSDPIHKYDGSDLSRLTIDIDVEGGPDNDINSALIIILFKNRLILFRTNEKGTDKPQRGRWCSINNPEKWPANNFKDAPTEDFIVSADLLDDELYVKFERSIWRFAWTGDSSNPFEWQRISDTDGTGAQMASVTRRHIQYTLGQTEVLAMNGRDVTEIDQKIPDFMLDWVLDSLPYSWGIDVEEERQAWFSYTSVAASANADGNIYPDRALIFNYEDFNFASYRLPIHSLGQSFLESDVTWQQDIAWEDYDDPWNAKNTQSGFPVTLMGSQDGFVYQLNTTGSDDGSDISFEALSARLNPWTKQGLIAELLKIQFLVTVDVTASFDISSYVDSDNTAFQTKTITCTNNGTGGDNKAWHTIFPKVRGFFHRFKLSNTGSSNRPRIHAILLYMRPAGRNLVG
jgi:hypothetical protein